MPESLIAALKNNMTNARMHWFDWMFSGIVFVLVVIIGMVTLRLLFRYLARLSKKTTNRLDDILVRSAGRYTVIWSVLFAINLSLKIAPVSPHAAAFASKSVLALFLITSTFLVSSIASAIIRAYSENIALSLPLTSLTESLIRIVIIVLGTLMVLAHLGVSITPLLTAMGVGSLAVALALQDTLSSLFSGFYILATRQIRPGDYIKLDSGQEGYVVDINWRSTRIRELSNNITIIPNSKISSAIVTNFYFPEKEMSTLVQVGVSYGSDLEKVERVTVAVARETLREVPGGVADFEPFIRYHTLGDSAVQFTVILRVHEFVDRYLVTHEFIKRLRARYQQENIEIPFPQRVVTMQK